MHYGLHHRNPRCAAGKWNHLVGTYEDATTRMYVNGMEMRSVVHAVGGMLDFDDSVPVTIGAAYVNGSP